MIRSRKVISNEVVESHFVEVVNDGFADNQQLAHHPIQYQLAPGCNFTSVGDKFPDVRASVMDMLQVGQIALIHTGRACASTRGRKRG